MRSERRRFLQGVALMAVILATSARAEDWRILDDAGVSLALAAHVLQYPDGASQHFFTDGRTLYEVKTGTSWGKWWVEAGQYCSTWPPSETPSCFKVEARGQEVRFTGGRGDVIVGRYAVP